MHATVIDDEILASVNKTLNFDLGILFIFDNVHCIHAYTCVLL